MEMIEIEQPAFSSSSCACKWEDGCPEFSSEPFKTEPTPNEDMKEVGNMNSCRLVIKTEPVDCKQFQCDLCQESVDHSSSLRSDSQSVPDSLNTNRRSVVVISQSFGNTHLSGSGSNLEKRRSTYTGKKPYPCSLCNYKASQSSNLKKTYVNSHWRESSQV